MRCCSLKLTWSGTDMNRVFKVIGRHPHTHRQAKKRVYTSVDDYKKYSPELTKRYTGYLDVEHYEQVDNEWKLLGTFDYISNTYSKSMYSNWEKSNGNE